MSARILIDTQALIWFAENAPALSAKAVALVDDPLSVRAASVASIWEMAIKISIGKLILKTGTLTEFVDMLRANEIELLPDVGRRRRARRRVAHWTAQRPL